MAFATPALVGSVGTVSQGSSGAAVTPAYGQTTTAKNLLVLVVASTGSVTIPTTPSGWTLAKSIAGTTCASAIFYKLAAGSDAAPTVALITSSVLSAQLMEFSGCETGASAVSSTGSAAGTTSPAVATNAAADANNGLMVSAGAHICTARTLATQTDTYTNGTAIQSSNKATSTANHYDFCYSVTTAHASADSDSLAFTTTQITGMCLALVSFKPAVVCNAAAATGTGTAYGTPRSALATAATGTGTANNASITTQTWVHRQQSSPTATGASTDFVSGFGLGSNLVAGGKLIAVVTLVRSGGDSTCTTTGVDDGAGHTFTRVAVQASNNGAGVLGEMSVWVMDTPTALVGTQPNITARVSNTSPSTSGEAMFVQEVTGLAAGTGVDGTPGSLGGYASALGPPTYATATAGEYLLYCYGDWGSNVTLTAPAGYTGKDGVDANGADIALGTWKNSTGGTETGTWSNQVANNVRYVIMVAFPLPSANVNPPAGNATGTGSAYNATVAGAVNVSAGVATGTGTANNATVTVPPVWTHVQSDFNSVGSADDITAGFTSSNVVSNSKIIAICEVTRTNGLSYQATTLSVEVTTDYPGHVGAHVADFTRVAVAVSNNGSNVTNEASVWVCDTPEAVVGLHYPDWVVHAHFNAAIGGSGQALLIQEVTGLALGSAVDGTPGTLSGYASALGAPTYASSVAGEYLLNAYIDWGSNTGVQNNVPAGYTGPDGGSFTGSGVIVAAYKSSTGGTETGTWGGQTSNQVRETILLAFPIRPAGQVGPGSASGTGSTGASVPWSRRQAWAADFGATNTASQTFVTSTVRWGSKLIAVVTAANAGGSPSCVSVDDGTGHNFTLIDRISNTDGSTRNMELSLWALDVHVGIVYTKPTITANLVNCATSAGTSVGIQEITGIAGLDGTPVHSTQFTTGTSAPVPAYTSTAANEYLAYCYGNDGAVSGNITYPSGTSPDGLNTAANVKALIGYKNSTGGTETGSWTYASANYLSAQIVVAFRPSNTGANATTTSVAGVTPNAGLASGTGTAYPLSTTVKPTATAATPTGTAFAPSTTVKPAAGVATGSGAASNATITATGTAHPTAATGTGTGNNATIVTTDSAPAGTATATGTAYNATTTHTSGVSANAGLATGSIALHGTYGAVGVTYASMGMYGGATFDPTPAVAPSPTAATATGIGYGATDRVATGIPAATGTGTAYNAVVISGSNAVAFAGNATATGTAYPATITATGTAHPTAATGTGTAYNPSLTVTINAGSAAGTGTAFNPSFTASASIAAGAATATGTAFTPTIRTTANPTAGVALGTFLANNPTVSTTARPTPTAATGTGVANNATVATSQPAPATAATATGTAFNAVILGSGAAPAGTAVATGTAFNATTTIRVATVTAATGTGTAFAATTTVSVTAGAATGTATANNATISTSKSVAAGQATPSGTANSPSTQVSPAPTVATATGTAFNPTIVSGADKTVQPGVATGTATAFNPTITATGNPNAGLATATGIAFNPTAVPSRTAPATAATATGVAFNATVTSASTATPNAGLATATGVALQPSITASSHLAAGLATATGVAFNATATTASVTNVTAQAAFAAGVAYQPTIIVTGAAPAGLASATGVSFNATCTVTFIAQVATGSGAANQAVATVTVTAQPALAVGGGYPPSIVIAVTVRVATATGVAYEAIAISSAAGIAQIWVVIKTTIYKRNQKVSVLETSRQATTVLENKQKTTVLENRQKLTVEERRNKITVKEGEDVPRT